MRDVFAHQFPVPGLAGGGVGFLQIGVDPIEALRRRELIASAGEGKVRKQDKGWYPVAS